jgi:xyloglucan-specific exo-beta-1,4-glucanase
VDEETTVTTRFTTGIYGNLRSIRHLAAVRCKVEIAFAGLFAICLMPACVDTGGKDSSNKECTTADAANGGRQDSDADAGRGEQVPEFKGQAWHNVPIVGGGFVTGIVYNQSEPGLVYARTDIGGLYRWDPEADRWVALTDWVGFDDVDLTGIESVATDPVDPDRLYAAAGLYTSFWSMQNGVILRSSDRGKTFKQSMLPFKFGGNMAGRSMGERLAIDPNQHDIVYYGARSGNGLWKSLNAGVTWNRVESFTATGDWSDKDSNDAVGVVWVLFDPLTGAPGKPSQTLYAGVADTVANIYRSCDGGQTWAAIPGQPADGYLPHHGVLSKNGVLFVTYSNTAGPYDGTKGDVWKFDTNTEHWTRISPIPSSSSDDYFGYGGLAVDAQHPDTLVVTTMNSWWPDANIFRSVNGGSTWRRIWDWGNYPARNLHYTQDISAAPWLNFGVTSPVPPAPAVWLGWMIGDIEIDPFDSDKMMYVTGTTIYGTGNLTDWDADGTVDISVKALGIEEIVTNDLISPPEGAPLLSALSDVGGFRHEDITCVPSSIMTNPVFATGTSIDYAELKPNFIVRVGDGDEQLSSSFAAFSHDDGASWAPSPTQPEGARGGLVAVAADGKRVLWRPYQSTVSYTVDEGVHWAASTGLPAGAWIAADRVNPAKFYGSVGGNFYVSLDGGTTFTATVATGLPNSWTTHKAVPGVEGDIWLAGGSSTSGRYGLWHSVDSGTSFVRIDSVEQADVVGFGKAAPSQSYVALFVSAKIGGIRGIFRSDDGGSSWVRLNDGQHQYGKLWQVITGDPRVYGRVYVGTGGRGIIYSDIDSP